MTVGSQGTRERRWIVLGTDGRFITLGRASDPSEDEVRSVENALRDRGLSGWLAIMEGNPYTGALPQLLEVKPLGSPDVAFSAASNACIRAIAERRTELTQRGG